MVEKLSLTSPDLTQSNIEWISSRFPNVVTEGKDESGKLVRVVDFDALKQELSDNIVEGPQERYRLDWPGKREAMLTANTPITKTLRPVREESVDFDKTQNLFIEGDNLDALKLLQETYLGKVKMIYIDPPYNTGKDFIYKDDFKGDKQRHLEDSGQVDDGGGRLVANPDSSGRFHSDWLTMMYPRLKLARNLLRDDGIIFISIGDDEVQNLKSKCSEIFGRKNFCAQFIWNTEGNTDNQYQVKVNHEYILAYYKNVDLAEKAISRIIDPNTPKDSNLRKGYADNNINKNNPENPPALVELPEGFPASVKELNYSAKDLDEQFFDTVNSEKFISDLIKENYQLEAKSGLPVKLDDMIIKDRKLSKPCRIFVGMANKNKLLEFIDNDCEPILDDGQPLRFYINANAAVRYRREVDSPRNILSVFRNFGTTEKTKTYLKNIGISYSYPKPIGLMKYLIEIGTQSNELILDFFSGSGSTAEACMLLNATEGTERKIISVQLPEKLDPTKKEQKTAYKFCVDIGVNANVSEISKERIRRAGAKILEENPDQVGKLDVGFRVLKIDSSNMNDVYHSPTELAQNSLLDTVEHIKPDRTSEDLLFQVMLDWGVDLSLPIVRETIEEKLVFWVGENDLAACFEMNVTENLVKSMASRKPLRAVFRDDGFSSDDMKINADQLFKQMTDGHTDMKVV